MLFTNLFSSIELQLCHSPNVRSVGRALVRSYRYSTMKNCGQKNAALAQ